MTQDAIDFLVNQHHQVEALIEKVKAAGPDSRTELFDQLREMLAVHETAEELILRPVTRGIGEDGSRIADARMAEENEAKKVLAELDKADASSEGFLAQFAAFATDVLKHASNEEEVEFPLVREQTDAEQRQMLASRMEKVEKMAPTHPHPSAKTTAANAVLGPFAAVLDRVRDAVSAAIKD
ncbi:MAG TPA: hemerythrin domain-containing protein [Mycobacteriales bacterium]|nr:hemerythrin domain-containing protein [Mycobacteriales bacterium]